MGLIGAATIEGHLGVAGDVQRAGQDTVIRQRDPPNLGIRVGCDRNFIARFDIRIATLENGAVRTEHRLIVVGVSTERLPTGRPCAVAIEVADVEVLSPAVAGRVLAQRVTSIPSQVLYPLPAWVSMTVYLPFDSKQTFGGDTSSAAPWRGASGACRTE